MENKHVVVCCTVLPGYIANVGRELLSGTENTSLSYHPAFIAQGDIIRGFLYPDMVSTSTYAFSCMIVISSLRAWDTAQALIGEGSKEAGAKLQDLTMRVCENKPYIARMSPERFEVNLWYSTPRTINSWALLSQCWDHQAISELLHYNEDSIQVLNHPNF